jgi:general secretion pathway protein K
MFSPRIGLKAGHRRPPWRASRGAAILLAMLVLTLVATVAAAMVWQQSRAVEVEGAERARAQAGWMLTSGIDFAREVVRRYADADPQRDQPWDVALAETRLSTLLAADPDRNADTDLEAFLSGQVEDAQARYNLANLFRDDGSLDPLERATLKRLCEALGLSGVDELLVAGLQQAQVGAGTGLATGAAVPPGSFAQLRWLGLDDATLAALAPHVDLLPRRSPVNLNSATAPVIYAAIDGIDLPTAGRLVRQRQNRFARLEQLKEERLVPDSARVDPQRVTLRSTLVTVSATVRYEDRTLTERALLEVTGGGASARALVLRRERRPGLAG